MSKTDIWMPLFVADYLADTQHLTRDEHGGYLLLIMAYWRNAGPLKDDDKRFAAITRSSLDEWREIRAVISEFFLIQDGLWHHKRIDSELQDALKNSENKSDRAKKGAAARWGKQYLNDSSSNAQALLDECPSPSPTPKNNGAQAAAITPTEAREEKPPAAAANPIHARAIELTSLLRQRGASLQASDPRIRRWAETGVDDAQALAALEIAQQRRADAASPQPINAGLLDAILQDSGKPPRAPPVAPPVRNGRQIVADEIFGRNSDEQHDGTTNDITGECERIG